MMIDARPSEKYSDVIGNANVGCVRRMWRGFVVGAGSSSNPGVAAKDVRALSNAGIQHGYDATSRSRITAVIKESSGDGYAGSA